MPDKWLHSELISIIATKRNVAHLIVSSEVDRENALIKCALLVG